jgi:hypothetical protein
MRILAIVGAFLGVVSVVCDSATMGAWACQALSSR